MFLNKSKLLLKAFYPFIVSLFVFLPSLVLFYGIRLVLVGGLDVSNYDKFIYQLGGAAIFYLAYSVPVILGLSLIHI